MIHTRIHVDLTCMTACHIMFMCLTANKIVEVINVYGYLSFVTTNTEYHFEKLPVVSYFVVKGYSGLVLVPTLASTVVYGFSMNNVLV